MVATKCADTMTSPDLITDFKCLIGMVDTNGWPALARMPRCYCFTLRPGHSERAVATTTMLAAIRMLDRRIMELASKNPGLLPNEAKFAQDAMTRALSRIRLLREDPLYPLRESNFP